MDCLEQPWRRAGAVLNPAMLGLVRQAGGGGLGGTSGPADGPEDQRTRGPVDHQTSGPEDQGTTGPRVPWPHLPGRA